MWDFKSADTEAVKRRKNYILLVFKERLLMSELTPEMKTYVKLRLCIHYSHNIDKLTAKIRLNSTFGKKMENKILEKSQLTK